MATTSRLSRSVRRVVDHAHRTWQAEAGRSTTPAVSALTQAILGLGAVPVVREHVVRQLLRTLESPNVQLQSAAALTLANLMRRHGVRVGRDARRRLSELIQRSNDRNARRQAFAAGVLAALELDAESRWRWIHAALREEDWRIQLSAYDALKRWLSEEPGSVEDALADVQSRLLAGPTMSQTTVAADRLRSNPADSHAARVLARADDHGRNWAVQEIATTAFRDAAKRLSSPPEWAVASLRATSSGDNDRTSAQLAALRSTLPSLCRANPKWARPLLLEAAALVRASDRWPLSASLRRVLSSLALAAPRTDEDAVGALWMEIAGHLDLEVWPDSVQITNPARWVHLAARAPQNSVDSLLLSYTSLAFSERPPAPDPHRIAPCVGRSVGWRAAVRALAAFSPDAMGPVLQALRSLPQAPDLLAAALLPEPEATAALCTALADPALRSDAALLLAPPRSRMDGRSLPDAAWDGLERALYDDAPRNLLGFGKNVTSRGVAAQVAADAGHGEPDRAGAVLAAASANAVGLDAARIHAALVRFLRTTNAGHTSPTVADAVAHAVARLLHGRNKDTRRATGGELLRSLGALLPIGTIAKLAHGAFGDPVYSVRAAAIVAMAAATARSGENVAPSMDLLGNDYHLFRLSAAQLLNATDHARGLRHVARRNVKPVTRLAALP